MLEIYTFESSQIMGILVSKLRAYTMVGSYKILRLKQLSPSSNLNAKLTSTIRKYKRVSLCSDLNEKGLRNALVTSFKTLK